MKSTDYQGAVDPSITEAIARLHVAMAGVAMGDVSAIEALYSHSSDATSFFGWGLTDHRSIAFIPD